MVRGLERRKAPPAALSLVATLLLAAAVLVLCDAPAAGAAPRPVFAPAPQASPPLSPSGGPLLTADGRALGAVAAPVETIASARQMARASSVELPAAYDLRDHGRVPPVRDQGEYGTCWAFATMGSLESFLLPGQVSDFSEDNLVNYSGYSSGDLYQSGGNYFMSLAYLLRGSGPKTEAADPYPSPEFTRGASTRKWTNDVWLIPPKGEEGWNDLVKSAVLRYGAVGTFMYWDDEVKRYDDATFAYYYDGPSDVNHCVDIVGWDDAFPRTSFLEGERPESDGAWLIRNSWGTQWGDEGYFWLSYEDTGVGGSTSVAFTRVEARSVRDKIYGHDRLGFTTSMGFADVDTSRVGWMASVYRSMRARERLTHVGFYALASGKATVWAGRSLSALRRVGVERIDVPGYYTVGLSKKLGLQKGRRFVVAVRLSQPANPFPVPIQASSGDAVLSADCTALPGRSFVSADGRRWIDATSLAEGAAVCLKAVTRR